jgi:hypothetical protein
MAAKTVDEYAKAMSVEHQAILAELRAIIKAAAPKATAAIKWAQPVYEENGPLLFIRNAKNHVTIGFWRGAQLDDPNGLLTGDGEKMKHVKITSVEGINKKALTAYIKQALKLNREHGDRTKGK